MLSTNRSAGSSTPTRRIPTIVSVLWCKRRVCIVEEKSTRRWMLFTNRSAMKSLVIPIVKLDVMQKLNWNILKLLPLRNISLGKVEKFLGNSIERLGLKHLLHRVDARIYYTRQMIFCLGELSIGHVNFLRVL